MRRALLVLAVVVAASCCAGAGAADESRVVAGRAAAAVDPAVIAYHDRCSIFLIHADGTSRTRLTHPPAARCDGGASWSPDGRRLAFIRTYRDIGSGSRDAVQAELHVVGADGTGLHRVSKRVFDPGTPRWSPDGREIAVADNGGSGVVLVWADGRLRQRALTSAITSRADPSWSPDGRSIAVVRNSGPEGALFVVSVDGTVARRVTRYRDGEHSAASWSPDGRWIAFQRAPCTIDGFCGSEVRVVAARTRRDRVLARVRDRGELTSNGWSPDGARVLFEAGGNGGILTLGVRDGTTRVLTRGHGDVEAVWSGDGRRIAFTRLDSMTGGRNVIHVIDADGTGLHRLVRGDAPAWRP